VDRRQITIVACALALATLVSGASAPVRPIDKLGWLAGGVWSADASGLGGSVTRIDTRYEWTPNRSFIRFTTDFVSGGSASPHYAGDLFFDPGERSLMIWYMDESNAITSGHMSVDGKLWTISFRGDGDVVGVAGSVDYTVDIVRTGDDSYTWTLFADVDHAKKQVFALTYRRST
jgi:hypothetical protein